MAKDLKASQLHPMFRKILFLGPVLFLIFVNDLPSEVDCPVADDTPNHQTISCSRDTVKFQQNLDLLGQKWAAK